MPLRHWGNETRVNTTTANSQAAPVVTALSGGGYVVAWVDDRGALDDVVKFQRYDALGKPAGVETTVPGDGAGNQGEPSISTMEDGGFVIGFTDASAALNPDIRLARYSATGTPVYNLVVAQGTAPVVNGISSNLVLISHNVDDGAQEDSILIVVDEAGTFSGQADIEVSPAVDGFLQTTCITDLNIYSAYIDANGLVTVLQLDDFGLFIPIGPGINLGPTYSDAIDIDLNVLPNGRIVVGVASFTQPYFGAILDSAGFTLALLPSSAFDGDFTVFADNTIAYVYVDAADNVSKLGVFDSDGNVLSTINLSPELSLLAEYSITKLSDGRIIVVSTLFDGGETDIVQQIIDPREGNVQGSNDPTIAETLVGHDAVSDTMYGYAGNDTIYGLAGNDVIYGGAGLDNVFGGRGDDTIYGGADADMLMGGYGADDIDGGAGNDTISFVQSRSGVTVNLQTGQGSGGEAEGDTYISIELVRGSNFNDTLTAANTGSTLTGFDGVDTLTGGSGNDTFNGGNGADIINGGAGTDIAFYSSTSAAININLLTNVNTGGEAQGDVLTGVEQISGTSSGDTILGNALNNVFYGQGGNDRLGGGTGIDTLIGGTGSDTFVFALGDTGQTATTADQVFDYTKGAVGTGDKIDFTSALSIGGVAAAATATQADISQTTGIATFAAGSGTTMADALADIATSMTTGGNAVGEFAFFRVNGAGNFYQFISDGVAGVGANDVLVQLSNITTINSINLTAGDLTILT
jgi:Ca2+-binding RTX toxin-like protein